MIVWIVRTADCVLYLFRPVVCHESIEIMYKVFTYLVYLDACVTQKFKFTGNDEILSICISNGEIIPGINVAYNQIFSNLSTINSLKQMLVCFLYYSPRSSSINCKTKQPYSDIITGICKPPRCNKYMIDTFDSIKNAWFVIVCDALYLIDFCSFLRLVLYSTLQPSS